MSAPDPSPAGAGSDRAEHDRIRSLYGAHYTQERYRRLWSGPSVHLIHEGKWAALRPILAGLRPAGRAAVVVDLGAGVGIDCAEFDRLGFERARIVAVDLVPKDLRGARERVPGISAAVGDGSRLPLRSGAVDFVFQSTMISSVLDASRRAAIYGEVARVLRPGGAFLSYDTRYPNPWNPHTRPVGLAELRQSFPGWAVRARSLTLLPPLLRALSPLSVPLCRAAEAIPLLRSHLLAWAIKPEAPARPASAPAS